MLSPLRNRTYRRLFAAQAIALGGTGLATVAPALLAYELAGADAGAVLGTALAIKMMAYVGVALAANVSSVVILTRYKEGDANVRSVWLCSRNDALGNIAVMLAAVGVWVTATRWPDLVVAAIMAGVFVTSSVQILRQALAEMRSGRLVAH
jgi:hypothetical protein